MRIRSNRPRPIAYRFTLPGLLVLAACGGDGSGTDEGPVATRDSAGIAIVENGDTGTWAEGWTVEEVLTIGEAAGQPEFQFGQIAGVGVTSDGQIAVLDQQAQEVRFFSADGEYLRTVGGPGSGPGEFSAQTNALYVGRGDTVVVPDLGNQRVNVIPPEGEPTNFAMRLDQGIPMRFDMTDGGDLVAQRRMFNPGSPGAGAANDLITRQGYDGTILDTLLSPERGKTFEMGDDGPTFTIFSPEPMWSVLEGSRVAFAVNDAYRISIYGPDGSLSRIVTRPFEQRPVTESNEMAVKEIMRKGMEEAGAPPQAVDQMISRVEFAEFWPAFTQLRGGPDGTLWVQRIRVLEEMSDEEKESWNPQLDQGSPDWDVFESDGRYGGVVTMPEGFTPFTFVDDRVYGVFRDDFDVQYVRAYRLGGDREPGVG